MAPHATSDLASWIARAARVTPGGVNSPVRAFKAMGLPPIALVDAHGAHVTDTDGRRYIDWIGAWGPALLGRVGLIGTAGEARAAWLLLVGILLFSGSLYVLAVSGIRALGAITPLGGLAFIAGWLVLAYEAVRSQRG